MNAPQEPSKSDDIYTEVTETIDKSISSKDKKSAQITDVAPLVIKEEISEQEEGGQRLSERLKQRDLVSRLYELANAVKGVRHAGHVRFELMDDASGRSLVVHRESKFEEDETSQLPSISETIQRKNDERGLKAEESTERSNEAKPRNAEAKRQEQRRINASTHPKDEVLKEQNDESLTAREQLERRLLAAKPLPNYANALGYVDTDRPYGDSGFLDVFA